MIENKNKNFLIVYNTSVKTSALETTFFSFRFFNIFYKMLSSKRFIFIQLNNFLDLDDLTVLKHKFIINAAKIANNIIIPKHFNFFLNSPQKTTYNFVFDILKNIKNLNTIKIIISLITKNANNKSISNL